MRALKIRQFRSVDLEAVYAISLATGHNGGDASHLYQDGKLIGHIYSAPYAALEARLALVVEDDVGVAGFVVGTSDTERWHDRLEAEWWPQLRREYDDPSTIPSAQWSADQRRAFAIHHPEQPPKQVVEAFPAHLHLNLSSRLQGRGAGVLLFSEWVARASRLGIKAMHVGVNRANGRAARFWSKMGFEQLQLADDCPSGTIWMGRS
ncbi:GNAT family N-acetyltransferase [Bradyrhizobium sp. BR13661]|jgi:GNAT superfamily N-acetyltransferase|uniref:GNAT family N-acetyltransferase n=1 Tax=Bradyrhizobium sp. BR13661 TaxID=2940622 RepID=UPI00247490DF|nr:GNAT family N-acetyltransferase [Bradyrhizobium sp. BR13661]MDH6260258.1 GNAT superfamily N-acetyltransferase [Bradyrhizobium sp. BR13661]